MSNGNSKLNTEENVYQELLRLIQLWRSKEKKFRSHSKKSYLSSIKRELRSPKICQTVFSNPDIFNANAELKYCPIEFMTDNFLIPIVYNNPKLLCAYDDDNPKAVDIPEDKQTLPVLIAYELGKRRYEKYSAMSWGQYGEKIPYTGKALEYRSTINNLADNVENKIGINNLKHICSFENENERIEFTDQLISAILEESDVIAETDKRYVQRHSHLNYNSNKNLLILISGCADSGKTTLAQYLRNTIDDSICFDSDLLLERGLLDKKLSNIICYSHKVVIFSDLDAFVFFSSQEIEDAMGDANILKVHIKPSSARRMLQHSKYRQRS